MKHMTIMILCCFFLLITQSSVLPFHQEKMMDLDDLSPVLSEFNKSIHPYSTTQSSCITMQTTMKSFDENQTKPPLVDDLLPSFCWTNNNGDWTSPVKDQRDCGSCWDFAAIGLIESLINIKEGRPGLDPDLSEQYVLSCLSQAGSCRGGLSLKALELIKSTEEKGNFYNGVPLESCMPYQANDTFPCDNKCMNWTDYLIPITEYGSWNSYGSKEDRDLIKSMIMEKGPVITDIYASEDFRSWGRTNHKNTDVYPYEKPIIWSNHVVLIVGWKDDINIPNGGYWICKNSWGKSWGYNGFFNIEYGGQGIDNGYIIWADYDPLSYDWNPVAQPGGPYVAKVNEIISFNGVNSFDAEDNEIEYTWDFGNNITKTGEQVSYQYPEKGIYEVSLTVTDTVGKSDTQQTAVFIEPWKEEDSWTYRCNNLDFHVKHDAIEVFLQSTLPQLTFEITNEKSNRYTVFFQSEFSDDAILLISYSSLDQELVFTNTKFSGFLSISKNDLSISDIQIDAQGWLGFKNFLPSLIKFPFSIELDLNSGEGLQLLNFPLSTDKTYDIPLATFDVNGTIRSPLFDIVHLINTVAKVLGKNFLPEDVSQLLPDIDLKEALDTSLGSNRLTMPCLPGLNVHNSTKSVEAGSFQVYTIQIPNIGEFSYSHTVENIVQAMVNPPRMNTLNGFIDVSMDLELIDTTYE